MNTGDEAENVPIFDIGVEARIARSPEIVYRVVSDLPRSHQWSEECTGGEWVEGEPGALGSVFRGHNVRSADVVAWAPVVRGAWTTTSEVVVAEPVLRFAWAIRTLSGQLQDSVWGFTLKPADDGTHLVHHFRMGTATEGIQSITSEMDDDKKNRFFNEWEAKLKKDMAATVGRLKKVLERD